MQVGIIRLGRYVKGKKVGKGNIINVVRPVHILLCSQTYTWKDCSY